MTTFFIFKLPMFLYIPTFPHSHIPAFHFWNSSRFHDSTIPGFQDPVLSPARSCDLGGVNTAHSRFPDSQLGLPWPQVGLRVSVPRVRVLNPHMVVCLCGHSPRFPDSEVSSVARGTQSHDPKSRVRTCVRVSWRVYCRREIPKVSHSSNPVHARV